jgi:uncharacterized protein YcnI
MPNILRRVVGPSFAATVAVLVVGAGVASAHIDPDPAAVEAGTPATVGFGVEHGCEGSPTIALDIELPEELTDTEPVAKPGWEATIDGRVLTFSGGPLDADTPDTFSITFTAPTTPGTLLFPTVQKCTDGEIAWIAVAAEGEPEPEHPAPQLLVTAGPPTSEELAPPEEEEGATETTQATDATDATDATVTVDTAVAADTSVPADSAVTSDDSDDSSNVGLIVGGLALVVVVGAGAYLVVRSRNRKA